MRRHVEPSHRASRVKAAALLQPPSTKIMAWFIFGAVALTIIFLFLGQYARKETVVGYLRCTRIGY
jgi:hypothetical protein